MSRGNRVEQILNEINRKISELEAIDEQYSSLPINDKKSAMVQARRYVQETENQIAELDKLSRTIPVQDRDFFSGEIDSIHQNFPPLKQKMSILEQNLEKELLLQGQTVEDSLDRDMLEADGRKVDGINAKIGTAININANTINTIDNTNKTLQEDRNTLGRIDGKLDEIDAEAAKGSAAAVRMKRRQICINIITWCIVVVLLAIDIIVFYFYRYKHNK